MRLSTTCWEKRKKGTVRGDLESTEHTENIEKECG